MDDTISRAAALNCVYGTSPNKIKGRISELPSATDTNVGGNLIDRQAAISEIMEDIKDRSLHDDPATPEDYAEGYDEGIRNAAAIVLRVPSVQPDVPDTNVGYMISRQGVLRLLNAVPSEEFATKAMLIRGVNALPSAQPVNIAKLQPNCNQVASDCISRVAAIKAADSIIERDTSGNNDVVKAMTAWKEYIKALPSAQPVEDARAMCGECDAWNKYKNYPQPEQFNPCTICQEFDCTGCKFRRI